MLQKYGFLFFFYADHYVLSKFIILSSVKLLKCMVLK